VEEGSHHRRGTERASESDVSSVIYIYNFSGEIPEKQFFRGVSSEFLPNQYLLWETVFLESNWILMLSANLREGSRISKNQLSGKIPEGFGQCYLPV